MQSPRQELESALAPLAWVLNFIWDTIRLVIWLFVCPLLIISWCFYHPVEAHSYFVNAIPLFWAGKNGSGDWATRGMLVFFVILIATQFGKTMHKICWWMIKLVLIVGVIGYIYLIFKLA
jgi:hypothetical protein